MTSKFSSAGPASPAVNTQIAPDDGMWDGDMNHYFGVGQSALHCILVAMQAAQIDTVTNILDLPCGHGRVLRHLQSAFPGARLTACDLNMASTPVTFPTFWTNIRERISPSARAGGTRPPLESIRITASR